MKKLKLTVYPLALLLAAIFLTTTACSGKNPKTDGNVVSPETTTISESDPSSKAEETTETATENASSNNAEAESVSSISDDSEDVSDNNIIGVWRQADSAANQNYEPMITFNSDDSFLYRVNLLSAMGNVIGTYEVKQDGIYCYVTNRSFSGFTCETVTEFVFRFKDNELIYEGENMGLTIAGDSFKEYDGEIEPLDMDQFRDAN